MTRVAKELSDAVKLVRENFAATLTSFASGIARDNPDAWKAQIAAAQTAGAPIIAKDKAAVEAVIRAQVEAAMSAAADKAEAEAPPDTMTTPEAEAPPVGEVPTEGKRSSRKRELVTA